MPDAKPSPWPTPNTAITTFCVLTLPALAPHTRREQRFVKEVVSGVTRWRRRLDYIISNLTTRSIEDLDPIVRQVRAAGAHRASARLLVFVA
jgi:hypothetical protein